MENLVLSQMVKDFLDEYKKQGYDKISYNYAYPVKFAFGASQQNVSQNQKISISGSQLFIFRDILFSADGDFNIIFKDVSTGRELSESSINSQVLSYKSFTGYQYKGIYQFSTPKVMTGASELYITVENLSQNANNVLLNINGVSINDR